MLIVGDSDQNCQDLPARASSLVPFDSFHKVCKQLLGRWKLGKDDLVVIFRLSYQGMTFHLRKKHAQSNKHQIIRAIINYFTMTLKPVDF